MAGGLRRGNAVVFSRAVAGDAGIFTCRAENWAGTGFKDVELLVLGLSPGLGCSCLGYQGEES